jgi:phosphatidylserine/phosphatidylglycerophosphate/cardiolipin synthase-like enzyme
MTNILLSLPPSDLRALASSVRSGRLMAPYSTASIERLLGASRSHLVSSAFSSLISEGMQAPALASTLDLLAGAIESRPTPEAIVDLVTTGPDGTRLTTRDTGIVVAELFRKSCTSVLIAGYAVYQGRAVFKELGDRMKEKTELSGRMFLDIQRGSDTSAPDELVRRFLYRFRTTEWPEGAPLPQIYYDPRALSLNAKERAALHAKCVVVDGIDVFVSSANFTEAAQQRNVEVGLLLQSPHVSSRLTEFFESLVEGNHFRRIA